MGRIVQGLTTTFISLILITACGGADQSSPVNSGNNGASGGSTTPTTPSSTTTLHSGVSTTTLPVTTTLQPVTTTLPPSSGKLEDLGDINLFTEIAEPMGKSVDNQNSSSRELMPTRNFNTSFAVDTCDPYIQGKDNFAYRIAYAVYKRMQPMQIDVGSSVAPLFGLNSSRDSYLPSSLLNHPFCNVTAATLNTTYEGKNIPSAAVIAKAQQFSTLMNQYRTQALAGSRDGKVKAYKLWTKFMMCLGYMESLSNPDTSEADKVASSFNFRRPAGVNLHNDSNQTNADSELGIGIFQESNVVKWGDTYSCVTDWNMQFPSCKISTDISRTNMIPVLGSTYQTFNAYCGTSVITRMFGVQINATRAKNTHPQNVNSNGSLKAPADRCVSPFMDVNTSYNHFAPLQNGSGFTLDNILSCTLAAD